MKKTTLALLLTTALVSSSAFAATSTPTVSTTSPANGAGFYAGFNAGGYYNTTSAFANGALNLHGGYMFNPYIGVEVGGTLYEAIEEDDNFTIGPFTYSGSSEYSTKSMEGALKAVYPINDSVSLFGKAGAMYLKTHYTSSANGLTLIDNGASQIAPYFGAGIGFNLMPQLILNLGGEVAITGNSNSDDGSNSKVYNTSFYYAGLDYHF